ncbi:hypothetical protein B0H14DRAFT_2900652 [Mycena olivaceomarginata]|nr:hypothetical protein B0H14DRAFT_2900652 [Mycena olivaceomarginata]
MLLDLSLELLEEVGNQLGQKDHANLRAVCRSWAEMYSEAGVEMLKVLAAGQTGWSSHARTLHIRPGKDTKTREQLACEDTVPEDEMQELLTCALKSMADIRTVIWKAHCESCPKWEVQTICAFLKGLSALCELELDFQGNLHLPSLNLAHIKKFTFKNTAWAGVSITPSRNPTSFQEIIALITENRLVSLHLEAEGEWNQVWSLLRGKTLLTEATTSLVTPELFAYLRSYTGLKKLTLIHPDGGSHDKSNLLADMFFETVLPRHATSLVELSCAAAYEGRFSFGTHNVDIISQMFSLTALEMSINAGRVREVDPKKMDRSNPNARRMIWIGQQVEIEQSDIDPVVTLLLQTAATLPALRSLAIVSADTEANRGVWCGNGITHHQGPVTLAIEQSVKEFRSNVLCSAIVRAGHHTYELKSRKLEGRAGEGSDMLAYHQTGTLHWQRF